MKSIPVTLNGVDSPTLIFGSGGGSGDLYGLPFTRRHVTHARTTELTTCLIAGIQNFCRMLRLRQSACGARGRLEQSVWSVGVSLVTGREILWCLQLVHYGFSLHSECNSVNS